MMRALEKLTSREKLLVLGALPLIALFALYQFGWVPLSQAREAARAEIASYRILAEAAAQQGEMPIAARAPDTAARAPLANRITQSAASAGVLVRRLEPEGALVRVTLDNAPFDTVIAWIAAMESRDGIAWRAAELDRRTAPGIVAARLTLENAE